MQHGIVTLHVKSFTWIVFRDVVSDLAPQFLDAGLPTDGGVLARQFKSGSVSGYAKIRRDNHAT